MPPTPRAQPRSIPGYVLALPRTEGGSLGIESTKPPELSLSGVLHIWGPGDELN